MIMNDGLTILRIVSEYTQDGSIAMDVAFADLNIDSLEFLQIINDVEKALNIHISNDALSHIVLVRDLVAEAEALRPSS